MVKKRKTSYRKHSNPIDLPLNEEEAPVDVSEEKVETLAEERKPAMETEKPDTLDQIDDQIPDIHPEEIPLTPVEEPEEDNGAGTGLPVPRNPIRVQEPAVKPSITHVPPRPTVTSHPKMQPESNTLRYAIIAGGALVGIIVLYLLFFSGGKKKAQGPTIVEVTDVKEEKKSEKNSTVNNKMSSPRIIFGDLRRNPSLAVAPPVQQ